jgi:predicted transcriptional regulator
LNRKAATFTILLTMLTISVCFTAVASMSNTFSPFTGIQHVDNLKQLSAALPIAFEASLHNTSAQPLEQPTRLEIYTYIKENPGVHFRGICDTLGLSVGVVQYHLSVLEHSGLIARSTDGQNKRYFENNVFTKTDVQLISLMRHETTAKILTILAKNGSSFHKDIANCLGVSSQDLSWHMNQLKKTGFINSEKAGINVKYNLNNVNMIKLVLSLTSNLKTN